MADNEEKMAGSPIPKRTIRLKPMNPAAPAASASQGPSAPTLKLKSTAPQQAAPENAPVSTDTAKLARRTIKLVPQSNSPLSGPATATAKPISQPQPAETPEAAAPAAEVSTDTAKLSKRTIKLTPASGSGAGAAAAPSAPTIKLGAQAATSAPTIKLGSTPPAEVSTDTAKLSKRTIKLTPASGSGAGAAAAPSAPTIKLGGAAASNPSAPTIKLGAPNAENNDGEVSTDTSKITRQGGSTPSEIGSTTVKLRPQSQQTIRLSPSGGGQKLQVKKPMEKTGLAAAEAPEALKIKMGQAKESAGGLDIVCMVSSIVALLILGFVCFMMYAQYSNFFSGGNIDVPGVTRQTQQTPSN